MKQAFYFTERLPKDFALAALCGVIGALLGAVFTGLFAIWYFGKQYPHDGQNVLGVLYFGFLSMFFFGPLSAVAAFVLRAWQYRKLMRLQEEQAFYAKLRADRL